jgi:putative DNA primase/helicase
MANSTHSAKKGDLGRAALKYLERGWIPFPLAPRTKDQPLVKWKQFQTVRPTRQQVIKWWQRWPDANIGLVTGSLSGLIVADLDCDAAGALFGALVGNVVTPTSITSRGRHVLFGYPKGWDIRNKVDVKGVKLDLRGEGGYIVAPPSIHPSGTQYEWDTANGRGPDCPLLPCPPALLELLQKPEERSTPSTLPQRSLAPFRLAETIPVGQRNYTLFRYASSLRGRGEELPAILQGLADVNARCCAPPLPSKEIEGIAASAEHYPPGTASSRTAHIGESLPHLTDLGNARRLVERHGDALRYVAERATWLVWNGKHWESDHTGEVMRRAKETIRDLYTAAAGIENNNDRSAHVRWALSSESVRRLEAMVHLAKTEPEVAIKTADLDRDPWLLNVQNGTVDLRTGKLREHARHDLITRMAPVAYDPTKTAPTWLAFLQTVQAGRQEMVRFLARLVGYSLTGVVSEHVLAFLHGYGANGKSTFLNTILAVLGPYGKQGDPHLLIARNGEAHPTNMADLCGSRFVVCSEVDEGFLAEATVKQLTGGDRIKARFMHRDFFEFEPTHTLWLAANHKPIVKNNDGAIWRRIKVVPFTVTIPTEEQDRELPTKLLDELPGILAWALDGCLEWQRIGLAEPAEVRNATAEYRSDMDLIAGFIEERCEVDGAAEEWANKVYAAYREWCEQAGLHPASRQSFGRHVQERGFTRRKGTGGQLLYLGLRLR